MILLSESRWLIKLTQLNKANLTGTNAEDRSGLNSPFQNNLHTGPRYVAQW